MKKKSSVFIVLCMLPFLAFAEGYSLKQCVEFANKANGNIINANLDVEIAGYKVKEQIGSMLPQIDGSASYTDNLLLATTLLPGELAGAPGTMVPIQFGTQHNMNGGIQLTQKLFDPSFPVALKASKISESQARESLKLTKEQSAYGISATYYQTLVIGKQLNALRANLNSSAKLLASTELKFNAGMAKQIDVDKIRVNYNNLKSQVQQSELYYRYSVNNLKYLMGMSKDREIYLTDTTMNLSNETLESILDGFNIENRSEFQLQKIGLQAYEAEKDRNKSGYLPSLNFSANLGAMAMRKQFNFFDSSEKWYANSSLVFSLRVPIFDGLQRQQRIAQSNLNIMKSKVKIAQSEHSILLDLNNVENQYKTAVNNMQNEKGNLDLAEKVYKNTQLQYQQGTATTLELVQSENSYNESTNNYYAKLLNLYIARINLEQCKGNLLNYINNK